MSDAAKRRSSTREIPGALKQTWYCSVSLRWNRTLGRPFTRAGLRAARPGPVAARSRRSESSDDEVGVANASGSRDDDLLPLVRAAVVPGERTARDGRDDVRATDHRPTERMRAEDGLRGDVVDEVVRRVLDHRDLLEHDLALGVDVRERRPEHHVRHHVERALEPVVGDPGVDHGRLARRRRVQLAAELVEDLRDLLRRVARRALEEQVLDEVRDAGPRLGLVA